MEINFHNFFIPPKLLQHKALLAGPIPAMAGNQCAPLQWVLDRKYQYFSTWENIFPNPNLKIGKEVMRLHPAERRRSQRIHVQIPMFIRGTDAAGLEFLEITKTLDISATGAYLASPRAIRTEQLIHLTIPAPLSPSSSSAIAAETPPIHARVCRHRATDGVHLLGVEFLKPLD